MKTESEQDLDIQELITDLKNQTKIKKDYVVPSNFFEMKNGELRIVNHNGENKVLHDLLVGTGISVPNDLAEKERRITLTPLDVCHHHLSEKLGIPKRYYDKMNSKSNVSLLDNNVTHWFKGGGEKNYLVRTFIDPKEGKGIARAILSDRFLPIDNFDILLACLDAIRRANIDPKLFDIKGEITEKRFYARFSVPSIEVDAPNLLKKYRSPDDPDGNVTSTGIMSGFVITNSEVGHGQFSISPRVVILKCKNGLSFTEDAFEKKHLGAQLDEFAQIIWSDETREKNRELIISQIKDRIKQFLNPAYLGAKIRKLEKLADKELNYPNDTVQNVCSSLNLDEEAERSIINAFTKGADPSPFGVAQAITYYAHTEADADQRYDMEAQAIEIMEKIDSFDKPFVRDKKTGQLELPPFESIAN